MSPKNYLKFLLFDPSDESALAPVALRVALYGFLLSGILYLNSQQFDSTELVATITFVATTTLIEIMWKRLEVGRRLIWSLISLILLIAFIAMVLVQATEFREAWYRVNVVDSNIKTLTINSPIPIISANADGIIESVNNEAAKLTGWTNLEAKGKPLSIFMRPEKAKLHNDAFKKASEEISLTSEPRWIHTNGRIFKFKTKDGKLIDANIEVLGFPFKPRSEYGTYPKGQEVGFYAVIIKRPT
jgi:PAS domain S-box-containing protein